MSSLDVRRRRLQPEIMDQPGLDSRRHDEALAGLARVNQLSRSAEILWPALRSQARAIHPRSLRVLDVATGGGDVPVRLGQLARRAGLNLLLAGCDRSGDALTFARQRAEEAREAVEFFCQDATVGELPAGYDAIICSLFLHHLTEEQAIGFLARLGRAAGRLVLVNDLIRCVPGLVLAHVGSRLLSASPVVHVDGPRSVEGAFTPAEAHALAERAGLRDVRVTWHWPFRYLLRWRRP